ncbi:MAG: sugar phosphate isomerase/epimerase family protein [Saprospiraceae bacterium]
MLKRRTFIKNTTLATTALSMGLVGCADTSNSQTESTMPKSKNIPPLKISLAQWSLNRAFFANELDAKDFAKIAKNDYGISAVEYVNGFYKESATDETFWQDLKKRAADVGVENLLIMCDDEGDLGNSNDAERKKAVENHYKWVHAAKILGCHSIRVNAFGDGTEQELHTALVDGMGQLCDYAAKENINILIENHGLWSSNGQFITNVLKTANRPNFGTLPDFGNWCLNEKWGSTQNNKCSEVYDRYQGVTEFLPYAKGYSAKSYKFDANGDETIIDYYKMLQIAKDGGYDGYIGIEFEGETMSEPTGIRATKALLEKAWARITG